MMETISVDSKETVSEYADKLRKWLFDYSLYQQWNNIYNYQIYSYYNTLNAYNYPIQFVKSNSAINQNIPINANGPISNIIPPHFVTVNRGHIYKLGNIRKRFFAEAIDFLFLLLIKIFITYLFASYFDIIDISTNNFETVFSTDISIEATLNMTSELLVLELIHKVLVCFVEALYTRKGVYGVGGATPGKLIFGLKIVSCESIDLIPGETDKYLIVPGGDIGFPRALLRSFLKNFSIALMFPTFASIIMNPQRKALYDVVCKTIVVEENI